MKKNTIIGMTIGCLMCLVACDSERTMYEGEQYVLFSDSIHYVPVTVNEDFVYEIPIGTTTTSNTDRHYIVDVDYKKTNAQEGYHYEILSRNVTIKAGQMSGAVKIKGVYDHIAYHDSLTVTLRIIGAAQEISSLYKNECEVHLIKCLPFNIHDYIGDMRMAATFPFSTSSITYNMVKTEYINDSTLLIKTPFDQNHDIKVRFHTGKDDPFDQDIEVTEQIAFTDASYGNVAMKTSSAVTSFYLPYERAFVIYADMFLPVVGSFGTYAYIFEWRSPEQAEADKNGLTTPYSRRSIMDGGFASCLTNK